MTESDWKIFKQIKEKAIERYCQSCLSEFRKIIDDESSHPHERYLRNYGLVLDSDQKMQRLFDGHSRSRAPLQLFAIRSEGLADEALVARLSAAFQERTNPAENRW